MCQHWWQDQHHMMPMVLAMASLYFLGQDNWIKMQHDFLVMWCHWHWHYMTPMTLSVAHGIDASTGTSTNTKGHIIPLNNHLNITNAMVSLMAPSASCWSNQICPSNATHKPNMPITLCLSYNTSMSVYMPPMNRLQSTMLTGILVYILHYWYMPLKKHSCHTVPVFHCYCSLHIDPTLLHI